MKELTQHYPTFSDKDGLPLNNGYIYVGEYGGDPETNPIQLYWSIDGTILAAQPVRTLNGYPVYNGSPRTLYANSNYSIRVKNKREETIVSNLYVVQNESADNIIFTQTGSTTETTLTTKLRQTVSVKDFGAVGNGTTDDTLAIQAAIDSGASCIYFPDGTYKTSRIIVKSTVTCMYGDGYGSNATNIVHAAGATGELLSWDGSNRVRYATFKNLRFTGNNEASETYGLNLSGFDNCVFEGLFIIGFKLDGIYADVASAPINKQFGTNVFIQVTSRSNGRNGFYYITSNPSNPSNVANVYIACEATANQIGYKEETGLNNKMYGCRFQSNTVRSIYTSGVQCYYDTYSEGLAKPIELTSDAYGNTVISRSGYPLWNTYVDAGNENNLSVSGASDSQHLFFNPYFTKWIDTLVPTGLTAIPTITTSSVADANNPYGASLQAVIGDNYSGYTITLAATPALMVDKWVTVAITMNTNGVVFTGTPNFRIYTYIDNIVNNAVGEFVSIDLPNTGDVYKTFFYDVKFAPSYTTAGVTCTINIYLVYTGYSASSTFKIRSIHVYTGQHSKLHPLEVNSPVVPSLAQTALTNKANGINIHRKTQGRHVYNTTNNKIYYAIATTDVGAWRPSDGVGGDLTPA